MTPIVFSSTDLATRIDELRNSEAVDLAALTQGIRTQ